MPVRDLFSVLMPIIALLLKNMDFTETSRLCGSVQGQVGWSSEQLGLMEDVPDRGRGVGTR